MDLNQKVFAMIYGIIGIPFFGVLFTKIGDFLMGKVNLLEFKIFGTPRRMRNRVLILLTYTLIGLVRNNINIKNEIPI